MKKKLLIILTGLLLGYQANAQSYIITTIAGNGTAGYSGDGGQSTAAELNNPNGISIDRTGNILIADESNNRIRVINPFGVISTYAGNGAYGYSGDGGPATAAKTCAWDVAAYDPSSVHFAFENPAAYISEFRSNRIRYVNSAGVIITAAGNGSGIFSGDGGPATAAGINGAKSMAADGQGNLYIGEVYGDRIRKVNTAGIITTYAGTGSPGNTGNGGPATAANIQQPTSMTVDNLGNVYFTDAINMVVRKITPGGIISVVAGGIGGGFSGDGGPATNAKLLYPEAVAVDHYGNVYIVDQGNNRIRMVNTLGIITTIAGGGSVLGDGGPATAAALYGPTGVTVDNMENVYVTTYKDNRVRKLTLSPITVTATQTAVGPCGYNYDAAAATATGGYPPYTYYWSPGGETTPTISGQMPGVYTVTVTDYRGIQATQTVDMGCTNNTGTNNHKSINNGSDENTITIYPNPSRGLLNVKYAAEGSVIGIYNELGLNVKTIIAGNEETTLVDAGNLPNGIYFIRISNTDGSIASQQKIIKIQ